MTAHVVVFGREPVPGATKTRLAAGIGPEAAARVAAVLLDHTLEAAAGVGCPVTVSLADSPSRGWASRLPCPWEVQRGDGLGERMADAFERRFAAGDGRVVLVGSDCPGLSPPHLCAALQSLEDVPVVLGPAGDGGYWCVGQQAPGVPLFDGVRFSSRSTLRRTRERLRALGVAWAEIATLDDVDTAADLRHALRGAGLSPALASTLRRAADG